MLRRHSFFFMMISEQLILILYGIFLLTSGLRTKPGIATWHMFSNASRAQFNLRDAHGVEINPWEHVPSTIHTFDRLMIDIFLSFLRDEKRIFASGEILIVDHNGTTVLKIADSAVVE